MRSLRKWLESLLVRVIKVALTDLVENESFAETLREKILAPSIKDAMAPVLAPAIEDGTRRALKVVGRSSANINLG